MGSTTSDRFGIAMLALGILTMLAVAGSVACAAAAETSATTVVGAIVGLGLLMVLLGVALGFTNRAGDTLRTAIVAFLFPYAAATFLVGAFLLVGSIVEALLEVMSGTINYTYDTRLEHISIGSVYTLLSILPTMFGVYAVNRDTQDSQVTRNVLLLSCARVPAALVGVLVAQAMGGQDSMPLVFVLIATYLVITGFSLQHITRSIFAAMLQATVRHRRALLSFASPVPENGGTVEGMAPETQNRFVTNSQVDGSECERA